MIYPSVHIIGWKVRAQIETLKKIYISNLRILASSCVATKRIKWSNKNGGRQAFLSWHQEIRIDKTHFNILICEK